MNLSPQQIADFQQLVNDYYAQSGRHDLPWRRPEADGSFDPYKIIVSELMLQQTQVTRVTPKFQLFMQLFPTVEELASATLANVLIAWSGLGYNRRAKYLYQAAQAIMQDFGGDFPQVTDQLVRLPGVGHNTAGAIAAYAFNLPVVFVETNIRTVFFHHFFAGREVVPDKEVVKVVEQTLDYVNPREWYWALMDYGAYLKASGAKLNRLSKHYSKQSAFEGSKRQIRGQIIRVLALDRLSLAELANFIADSRLTEVLADLLREGLIAKSGHKYHLRD